MKCLTDYIVESQQVKLGSDGKEHGFEYVGLDLPSGTKWATCNVGAEKPEDPGLLFQFGRIDGYKHGNKNHKFSTSDENEKLTGNELINPTTSGVEYAAGQILNLEDDVAHINMGGDWIMSTYDDLKELYYNTSRKVITLNGKKGMLFTSNNNSKSIFVVFAGYWDYNDNQFYNGGFYGYLRSSEINPCVLTHSWYLYFNSNGYCNISDTSRAYGFSVRGILKK